MKTNEIKIAEIKTIRTDTFHITLQELMHDISHQIRQPIAHILGLSYLLEKVSGSPIEIAKVLDLLKDSAINLDKKTRELSAFIYEKCMKLAD